MNSSGGAGYTATVITKALRNFGSGLQVVNPLGELYATQEKLNG